jgi:autophagy-related protein 9
MEQSLLGFRAANPTWQPSDPSASLFLSRLAAMDPTSPTYRGSRGTNRQSSHGRTISPPTNSNYTNNRGHSNGQNGVPNSSNNNVISFTPANSTLAQRSQLYTEAFERSMSLATKPSNALALQASAIKTGNRSVAAKTLQAVSEDRGDDILEDDEDFDPNSNSAYEDARPEVNHKGKQEDTSHDQVNLRGLLQHIGSQW